MTARIDIPPGTVFGRLTVIGDGERVRGARAMLCRCECGTMKTATVGALRCGDAKSCGSCERGEVIASGAVFGRLTVIGEAPRQGSRRLRAMLCRCECGTEKVILLGNLRRGQRSCGCARSDTRIDVQPGAVFGYLTVLGEAPPMGARRVRALYCRCECGAETIVPLGNLRTCVSCGREYATRSWRSSFYCSTLCQDRWYRQQERDRQQEGRLLLRTGDG